MCYSLGTTLAVNGVRIHVHVYITAPMQIFQCFPILQGTLLLKLDQTRSYTLLGICVQ